jgi:hypothetical protein
MTQPPLAPDELVSAGTEREVLAAFLDLHRAVLRRKVGGLSDTDTRRGIVPSGTTLAGLVKHLAAIEREWFQRVLGRRSPEEIGADSDAGASSSRSIRMRRSRNWSPTTTRHAPSPAGSRLACRWTMRYHTRDWVGCHCAGSTRT